MSFDYLLDSWAWLEYFTGSKRGKLVASILESDFRLATTIIVVAELADKFARLEQEFEHFLRFIKAKATILPLTEELVLQAPKIKKELRMRHPDASLTDALNLAAAREKGVKLLTGDSDFEGIAGVELI